MMMAWLIALALVILMPEIFRAQERKEDRVERAKERAEDRELLRQIVANTQRRGGRGARGPRPFRHGRG